MRFVTMSALVTAALALAACGGSSEMAFDEDDVTRVFRSPSAAPAGASWVKHETSAVSPAQLRTELLRAGRSTEVADTLEEAGLSRLYEWGWRSGGSEAFASAGLFRDAAGAEKSFDTMQEISPNWIAVIPADDLGEQAVGGRSSDTGAGFTWRRENLILAVGLFKSRGPAFDYESAARDYAHELDERANAR